ncbi:hypothetical protein OOZ15_17085 [Galbibacter sp. EGI 63066]|uniref:hypothetical protein n=1 Tax=Galbibacter sp. EGI 63066 TaxID=2993559 RepID=UPI0022494733|nr:hypothetical protein [Galbibacter sp. EGI 63066]MCX2681670.1 hypothetical protein [Galbibacter sp. EGI 63066]
MNAVRAVNVPFLLNIPNCFAEGLNILWVKNKATKIFVRIVKKLKKRMIVSGIFACLFWSIKTNCVMMANHPRQNPTVSIFLRIFKMYASG